MKKSVKCIIAGGIIALTGAGLFAATLASGATGYDSRFLTIGFDREDMEFDLDLHDDGPERDEAYASSEQAENSSAVNSDSSAVSDTASSSAVSSGSGEASSAVSSETAGDGYTETAGTGMLSAEEIRALRIDVSIAEVEVRFGNAFQVRDKNVPDAVWNYDQETGTVLVSSEESQAVVSADDREIYITLPRDTRLTALEASIDWGGLEVYGCTADSITAAAAAGDISLHNCQTASLILDTAMGDIDLENTAAETAELRTSLGDIEVEGSSIGTLNADIEMGDFEGSGPLQNFEITTANGDIELEIRGSEADYYILLDTDLGSITSPSAELRSGSIAVGSEAAALYKGSAYTAMGNIELQFRQK